MIAQVFTYIKMSFVERVWDNKNLNYHCCFLIVIVLSSSSSSSSCNRSSSSSSGIVVVVVVVVIVVVMVMVKLPFIDMKQIFSILPKHF